MCLLDGVCYGIVYGLGIVVGYMIGVDFVVSGMGCKFLLFVGLDYKNDWCR